MKRYRWHLVEGPVSGSAISYVKLGGRKLCLLRYNGIWYATDARCPHANGPLEHGFVSDQGQLVCPWHRYAFDLKTGQCERGGYYIDTYPVREQDTRLFIGLPAPRKWWPWG